MAADKASGAWSSSAEGAADELPDVAEVNPKWRKKVASLFAGVAELVREREAAGSDPPPALRRRLSDPSKGGSAALSLVDRRALAVQRLTTELTTRTNALQAHFVRAQQAALWRRRQMETHAAQVEQVEQTLGAVEAELAALQEEALVLRKALREARRPTFLRQPHSRLLYLYTSDDSGRHSNSTRDSPRPPPPQHTDSPPRQSHRVRVHPSPRTALLPPRPPPRASGEILSEAANIKHGAGELFVDLTHIKHGAGTEAPGALQRRESELESVGLFERTPGGGGARQPAQGAALALGEGDGVEDGAEGGGREGDAEGGTAGEGEGSMEECEQGGGEDDATGFIDGTDPFPVSPLSTRQSPVTSPARSPRAAPHAEPPSHLPSFRTSGTLLRSGVVAMHRALGASGSGVACRQLLLCLELGMLKLQAMLGATFALAARNDAGNMRKVRTVLAKLKPDATVREALAFELSRRVHTPSPPPKGATLASASAAMGLTWLIRSLHFCSLLIEGALLQPIGARATSLTEALQAAYRRSLEPYHGWLMQSVFARGAKSLPTLDALAETLRPGEGGREGRDAAVREDLAAFAEAGKRLSEKVGREFAAAQLVDLRKV